MTLLTPVASRDAGAGLPQLGGHVSDRSMRTSGNKSTTAFNRQHYGGSSTDSFGSPDE